MKILKSNPWLCQSSSWFIGNIEWPGATTFKKVTSSWFVIAYLEACTAICCNLLQFVILSQDGFSILYWTCLLISLILLSFMLCTSDNYWSGMFKCWYTLKWLEWMILKRSMDKECFDFQIKGACSKIFGKWIFLKLADIVTFPTNLSSMVKKKYISYL